MRLLGNSSLQINVTLVNMDSYISKNTPQSHLQKFYKVFDEIKDNYYDGMIITGAPVETMSFDKVAYWNELANIMAWSDTHVTSTVHICWGAQAGLYYHYGIDKVALDAKLFGIYEARAEDKYDLLFKGMNDKNVYSYVKTYFYRRREVEKRKSVESSCKRQGMRSRDSQKRRQQKVFPYRTQRVR